MMAQIGNTNAFTEGDGQNNYVNIDTINKLFQLLNNAGLKCYSDNGATLIAQLAGGVLATAQTSSAQAVANGNTINTAGVGVARCAPAAAVTGVILQPGSVSGQEVWVVNESAAANSITYAASGTSNVADGASSAQAGLTARKFVWDSGVNLWFRAA